ncbi:T9SS type A sorting domain-containing protein [Subsaximicrobium wynnwilliamsii]|uniref:T9SS type A sorting domain-containing protein n=1 Tax=Subsaximicrobium wynnwilliamsii TaxID=291179 RepID=A0A5C6ZNG5_9FLAO|nr:M4 family metallopeptidase [Subsaximicrobium wynnwilliamsii]TXD84872.1 T9SS type A sorting domain-containing protein [Subsaximicrobium wynnwilliamsii]TXD90543.1 T9SS type A sorting domain-containing protein [Subsaximicrobium wynnwilliamsii]TXE05018.1 T9SS type A sorting domain-containing protein [Subsaximicrobium wynnwilliamsii]
MKKIALLFCCFLVINFASFGQNGNKTIQKLKSETKAQVTINPSNGIVEFIKFPAQQPFALKGNTLQQKAFTFLDAFADLYAIENSELQFTSQEIKTDNYGFKQLILKQVHEGVPVYDGQLRFHFDKNLKLTAINGTVIPNIKTEATAVLSSSAAGQIAVQLVEKQQINYSKQALEIFDTKRYIFPKGLAQGYVGNTYLVYEVEIRNNADVREFLYIDANTGKLVEQFTGIAHALNRQVYEENYSNLVWQEGDALPGDLDIFQQTEVLASGHMYHLFNNAFNYDSYDGAGRTMRTINNNPNIDCPNASWNGVTANYCTGTASDDVVAHEWGHAYTQFTSNLIYAYQAGAINESYSDIWGETVDLLNNYSDDLEDLSVRTFCNSSDRWRIGEDASAFGAPIRDMWNPNCNNDPGKVSDLQYRCGEGDSGGVHSNSGVPNHAYVLLVDGGSYNGQIIEALGFTKAAHVFWRAQSSYLTATSDFVNLADALEASATDLIGINLKGLSVTDVDAGLSGQSISANDLLQVVKAMLAVEMRLDPEACEYQPLLADSEALCNAATTGRVFFEDWETGTEGWNFEELPENAETWNTRFWTVEGNLPDGKPGQAVFAEAGLIGDCVNDFENGIMRLESPVINLPNIESGNFDLSFDHYLATEANWDGGNLKYKLNGGLWAIVPSEAFTVNPYNGVLNTAAAGNDNPMEGQAAFNGTDGGSLLGSWGTSVIDLSVLNASANDTVQFRWEMGTDGCNGRIGWFVDNIAVYNCSAETLSVSSSTLQNEIQVYPNPSNGLFKLKKMNNISLLKASVYDINGRLIQQVNLSEMTTEASIDMTNASTGMYFMKVQSASAEATFKLIKQ